jgi:Protein of unknown function (DUF4245)
VSQQPSRHQRSFSGLIGAMLVTVAFVLAFVGWRALFRSDADTPPPRVEWTESVQQAEEAGVPVVRPRELPSGWTATSVELRAGDDPRWGLGVLTDEEQFIGIRQEDRSVEELVRTYVDEDAVPGEDASVDSDVTGTWQTWSDEGGDRGYSTELGDDAVLVYGSAPVEDIEAFMGLLTQE